MSDRYYLIESGPTLDLIKEFIASRNKVLDANLKAAQELGVKRIRTDPQFGSMVGAVFDGERHPDFKVPNKNGVCHPKLKTAWDLKLKALPRHESVSMLIATHLNIPLSLRYGKDSKDNETCWRRIGSPLTECGFLWAHENGPYAMWMPDVKSEIKQIEKEGYVVSEEDKAFTGEFEGCRRIYQEQWAEIIHEFDASAKKASAAEPSLGI
jgi:hypothetical protein